MDDSINELVFSIHGVESHGEWQLKIAREFGGIDGLVHDPHVYGHFAFWKVLIGPLRNRQINNFVHKLSEFQVSHPHVRPSVIAHSFGTYIVSQALMMYPSIALDRVIFCGSIVARDFDWATLLRERRVRRVRNEVAGQDRVVGMFRYRMMRALVPDSGPSGLERFATSVDALEEQEFPRYRHSSHFVATNHCRLYWIPFLRGTLEFRTLCERCLDVHHPDRETALVEFSRRYDDAIAASVEAVFRRLDRNDQQSLHYRNFLRRAVMRSGANGRRTFDELLHRHTLALFKNVADR